MRLPSASAIVAFMILDPSSAFAQTQFSPPEPITAGGQQISDLLYPSPVLHDLDGDGARELILGDLPGHLYFCTAEGSGDDIRWSAKQNLQADGKPLKLHNW